MRGRRLYGLLMMLCTMIPCIALAQTGVSQLEAEGLRFGIVDDAEGTALYRLDEEGEPEDFLLPDIWEAVPYKDGKILALQIAADTRILAVDAKSGDYEALGSEQLEAGGVFGIAYDEGSDAIYFTQNGNVYELNAQLEAAQRGSIPFSGAYLHAQAHVEGGVYTAQVGGETYTSKLRREGEQRVLNIVEVRTYYDYDLFTPQEMKNAFAKRYPDVKVNVSQRYETADLLINALVDTDSPVDLLLVPARAARILARKGYCKPLDASEALTAQAKRLYPCILDAATYADELIGWPHMTALGTWNVKPHYWQETLGDTPYPSTVDGWLDLRAEWQSDDYALFHNGDLLIYDLVRRYIQLYEETDAPMNYDTPQFRQMLRQIVDYEPSGARNSVVDASGDYMDVQDMLVDSEGATLPIAPPVYEVGQAQRIELMTQLLIVPQNAAEPELALDFLECMAQNLDPVMERKLFADATGPVRNKTYEASKAFYVEQIEKSEAEMAKETDPVKQADWQEIIDSDELALIELEDEWLISEASLARYKGFMEHAFVASESRLDYFDYYVKDGLGTIIQEMIERYHDGQLTIDEMVRTLNKRSQMEFLEGM